MANGRCRDRRLHAVGPLQEVPYQTGNVDSSERRREIRMEA